ncbi:MAG: metallophosphoesterase [Oscillospiraceae bacterium]|nr:metallophosphoesterase [Oscillospiraceae bacterium]
MALYAIGDLHLSQRGIKPMGIFGEEWENHAEKLTCGFSCVGDNDLTVLCGDLCWGMSMADSLEDFQFVDRLPGKKLLLKGNHDYWWSTAAKARRFFEEKNISTIDILHNNCFFYEDYAICGTRGWFYEEETGGEHDKKIMLREIGRLETSLKAAGDKKKLVFLHYPPIFGKYECKEILSLLDQYGAEICCYGHIHGKGCRMAFNGWRGAVEYRLVSADHLGFCPQRIL